MMTLEVQMLPHLASHTLQHLNGELRLMMGRICILLDLTPVDGELYIITEAICNLLD